MPKKIEITCDHCERELTSVDSGFNEFRIMVQWQTALNTSSISLVPKDRYFCDLICLEGWVKKAQAKE